MNNLVALYYSFTPDSVLSLEWIQALADGRDQSDILPFSGRPKLPTKEMVIKLYLYYRYKSQHKKTSAGDKAWRRAGNVFPTSEKIRLTSRLLTRP